MKLKSILNGLAVAALTACLCGSTKGFAQAFTENFDDITLLAGNGWSLQNLSSPVGSTGWFQGNPTSAGGPFDSYNGAANSYIAANFNNTGNTGTISNWLITPNRTFRNGDVITFFTKKASPDLYPDRLEFRMSTNGASTNAGATATSVGDFTTLLLSINPSLTTGIYPTSWTMYTITISSLSAPTSGRLALRYFVTGAGLNGSNSDYIGIDNVVYTPYVCPTITLSSGPLSNGTAGAAYATTITQTGCLGAPSFAVTAGALPPGLTLSSSGSISGTPTATGTFNFTITASDASGCSGSQAYSITIVCPTNGASLATFPVLCSNDQPYTLVEGSPTGGSYSGTGVNSGAFDPSSGTQAITYTLTDAYGCPQSATGTLTVNNTTSSTMTATSCDSYSSPAGHTYTVTGTYKDTLTNTVGCDSIITIDLTINNSTSATFTTTSCDSYAWQGSTYTVSGTYTATIQNAAGCDSNMTLNLTILHSTSATFTATNCESYAWQGNTYTVTGTYMDTIPNMAGCDSVMTLNLTILNSTSSSMTATACDNYTAPSGAIFTTSGAHMDTIPNSAGCDSVITVNLTILNSTASSLTVSSCGSYAAPSGATYTTTGTYMDTIPNTTGCDSVITIHLTVNSADTSVTVSGFTLTATATSATYQWLDCSAGNTPIAGATNASYNATANGNYAVIVTQNGCTDTSGCHTIAGIGIAQYGVSVLNVYPNPTNGSITLATQVCGHVTIYNQLDQIIYSGNIQEGNNLISLTDQPNGIYLVRFTSSAATGTFRLVKH